MACFVCREFFRSAAIILAGHSGKMGYTIFPRIIQHVFRFLLVLYPEFYQLKLELMVMDTDPIILSKLISFPYVQCRQPIEKYLYLLMLKEREKDWMTSLTWQLTLCAQRNFHRQVISLLHLTYFVQVFQIPLKQWYETSGMEI